MKFVERFIGRTRAEANDLAQETLIEELEWPRGERVAVEAAGGYTRHEYTEPTVEQLDAFFGEHPDAHKRFMRVGTVPMDTTDSWGIFGDEKNPDGTNAHGYLFATKQHYAGQATIADELMKEGHTAAVLTTPTGDELLSFGEYVVAPTYKFNTHLISQRRTPGAFAYVERMFGYMPPIAGELPAGSMDTQRSRTIDGLGLVVVRELTEGTSGQNG
jgi:hypothetical protein